MTAIDWSTAVVEPGELAPGFQLQVRVDGVDANWVERFDVLVKRENLRDRASGKPWDLILYYEPRSLITVDGLRGDENGPIRLHLDELVETASHTESLSENSGA